MLKAWLFNREDVMLKFLAVVGVIIVQNAYAIDLTGYRFTDSYRYSLLEDGYSEKFPGKWVFTGSYSHVDSPVYYTDSRSTTYNGELIDYNNVLTFGFGHYLTNDLQLGLETQAVQTKVAPTDKTYNSLGDTTIKGKWRFWSDKNGMTLALNPRLVLPTGKEKSYTTVKTVAGSLSAVLEKHWGSWHGLASVGYFSGGHNKLDIIDYRNLILTQIGLSYDITKAWTANFESIRNFTVVSDKRQDEGDYFITFKNKATERVSLYGGAGIAGLNSPERYNQTLFVGLKIHEMWQKPQPEVVSTPTPPKKVIIAKPKSRSEEAKIGQLFKTENIYFENNIHTVMTNEMTKIHKIIKFYKESEKNIKLIIVEGYASKLGNSAHNLALSERRGQEVKSHLAAGGIPEEKIHVVYYGDNIKNPDPLFTKDRRVEFRIYQ